MLLSSVYNKDNDDDDKSMSENSFNKKKKWNSLIFSSKNKHSFRICKHPLFFFFFAICLFVAHTHTHMSIGVIQWRPTFFYVWTKKNWPGNHSNLKACRFFVFFWRLYDVYFFCCCCCLVLLRIYFSSFNDNDDDQYYIPRERENIKLVNGWLSLYPLILAF